MTKKQLYPLIFGFGFLAGALIVWTGFRPYSFCPDPDKMSKETVGIMSTSKWFWLEPFLPSPISLAISDPNTRHIWQCWKRNEKVQKDYMVNPNGD